MEVIMRLANSCNKPCIRTAYNQEAYEKSRAYQGQPTQLLTTVATNSVSKFVIYPQSVV